MDLYEFVRGPLAWLALTIFLAGSLYRIVFLFYTGKKEPVLDPSQAAKNAARSILHGLIPFGSTYMRRRPLFTVISFIFHLCVVRQNTHLQAHSLSRSSLLHHVVHGYLCRYCRWQVASQDVLSQHRCCFQGPL